MLKPTWNKNSRIKDLGRKYLRYKDSSVNFCGRKNPGKRSALTTERGCGRIFICLLVLSMVPLSRPVLYGQNNNKDIQIVYQEEATGRVGFGATRLSAVLIKAGFKTSLVPLKEPVKKNSTKNDTDRNTHRIYIGINDNPVYRRIIARQIPVFEPATAKEGFVIQGSRNKVTMVTGADASGALYGCLQLGDQLSELLTDTAGRPAGAGQDLRYKIDSLLSKIKVRDRPQMTLRGACIGLQKPYLLPGRSTYEYPYTKENFPWFYNKELWIKYLDMLVENRMNTLYLWSGHPFASLVRLKDYPEAVEVDSATFAANQEIFHFLTTEANKRGIWVIQAFYNIIVSKPFAEKHHIKTQDRNRPITPLIADYTRKSIAAFVAQYPNVGLLVTLGEAMEGVGPDDTKWFTKTIIPGVKDGLSRLGQTKEPPIILRAHDADAPAVIAAAKPLYQNLYTMAKYNGEALTTYQPRGPWAALHRKLSEIAPVQVENVHILANLEPFRYGADDFIQKCVQAMHKIYGSNGLHLYPQAAYWDWPYSADNTDPRLLQMDRDWIWYSEWARYAWNANRERAKERQYWAKRIAQKYGSDLNTGQNILTAYESSGEIAPKLLRRYGITDGNRQTLSLGMLMSQLIDPKRYGLFTLLYNSEAPEGEMITEYARKEWLHQKHIGETPVQIAGEVMKDAAKAVKAIKAAQSGVTKNTAEFERLKNDMLSYQYLAAFYSNKVMAALKILRYGYSHNIADLDAAVPLMEKSLRAYEGLARVAGPAYLYANSLQTGARKIPMTGKNGQFKTWSDLKPVYQSELDHFKKHILALKAHGERLRVGKSAWPALQPARVQFLSADQIKPLPKTGLGSYLVNQGRQVSIRTHKPHSGKQPFSDTAVAFDSLAMPLSGLKGIQVDRRRQMQAGTRLYFKTDQPVTLFVGFFAQKNKDYLKEPELETDASANDYGQAATKIANAGILPGYPAINVHGYRFDKGVHDLQLGKGICLLLGFAQTEADVDPLPAFDARMGAAEGHPDLDWLFR